MGPCPVWTLHSIFLSMRIVSTISSGRLISHQSLPNYLFGQISSWLCLHRLHQTQRMHKAQQPSQCEANKVCTSAARAQRASLLTPHFLPTCCYSQASNAVLNHSCLAFQVLSFTPQEAGDGEVFQWFCFTLKSPLKLRYFVQNVIPSSNISVYFHTLNIATCWHCHKFIFINDIPDSSNI